MVTEEYERLARLSSQHWWYRGMAAITRALLPRLMPNARTLDAGCGPSGPLSVSGQPLGVDCVHHALRLARHNTAAPLAAADVQALPFREATFDLVICQDVLYHARVSDDTAVLAEFVRVLRPGGRLLLRLPAYNWLRGAHDAWVHTSRRYSRLEVLSKLRCAGLIAQRVSYANTLLFPIVLVTRVRQQLQGAAARSDVRMLPSSLNRTLELVLRVEAWWLQRYTLPFGLSVVALATKPDHAVKAAAPSTAEQR